MQLKLPYGTLDTITPNELLMLYTAYLEVQREDMENLYNIIRVGVASGYSGKDIKLFDNKKATNKTRSDNKITKEERNKTLEDLDNIFY